MAPMVRPPIIDLQDVDAPLVLLAALCLAEIVGRGWPTPTVTSARRFQGPTVPTALAGLPRRAIE